MAFELSSRDLEPLLQGACFFGSGGGGTMISARHLAANFRSGDYYPTDKVRVVDVDEATDGDCVMVAYMGAPDAINRVRWPNGPVEAARAAQQRLESQGRKLAYVAAPESGALGFVVASLVAAKLGLAVVDADGAGRAVPSLPMLTYAAAGVPPTPAFLAGESGLCVELGVRMPPPDGKPQEDVSTVVEQMLRPILTNPQFGQFGGLAMWIMSPEQLDGALPVRGTLSRALKLGRALQDDKVKTAEAMLDFLRRELDIKGKLLFGPATLASSEVATAGGFDLGKVSLEHGERRCTVLYQNESLLAWDSAVFHPLATAPDAICYFVEGDGQHVFSNGDLSGDDHGLDPAVRGRKAAVIALPAAAPLRKGLILQSFVDELAQLGYLGPYAPVDACVEGAR
ncbi:DUF917 domain-containing protein [Chromobacterium vaccinii]|uniref:DUF917 domain-containing protein n=1 Tax=Chromobacterium vaccinii TaxID=1108595 RepID=UPI000617E658|nr:DUF917 domain-containing protein [Chromobacterium vaccinii]